MCDSLPSSDFHPVACGLALIDFLACHRHADCRSQHSYQAFTPRKRSCSLLTLPLCQTLSIEHIGKCQRVNLLICLHPDTPTAPPVLHPDWLEKHIFGNEFITRVRVHFPSPLRKLIPTKLVPCFPLWINVQLCLHLKPCGCLSVCFHPLLLTC